ncbi:MAG: pyridine nucleotide-disulfide oxidoreductase [Legionella sp.]|nr:MAG: pyridine nucleotide-disulfide oxidoreductase [Legionella sp.]
MLSFAVEPLQWITKNLQKKVIWKKATVQSLFLKDRLWHLQTTTETLQAQNVILATGATPSTLAYPNVNLIPFETAIDQAKLADVVDKNHTYAVFGSSHSAVIILRYLTELNVKKIINFYRSPCRYAVDMGDWILFDNTGLKGQTALWAREHLDGKLPENLIRVNANETNIAQHLPECDKVIYAVGFASRNSIVIEGYENSHYNPHVGIIGPGLFGCGIAYPELKADPYGTVESQVGMWKFMTYLKRVMPVWYKYST